MVKKLPEAMHKHKFSKTNRPKNPGRKKSILRHLSELTGEQYRVELSKADKHRIIESMLEKTKDELQAIHQDESRPIFMRIIANAIRTEMLAGDLKVMDSILNRVHGTPTQSTMLTGAGGGPITTVSVTPNDEEPLVDQLKKLGLPTKFLEE
jgi:hypothetical protein